MIEINNNLPEYCTGCPHMELVDISFFPAETGLVFTCAQLDICKYVAAKFMSKSEEKK